MTPQSLILTRNLKLCSGVTLSMLFTTLLSCWTQSWIMCTLLFPCKIRLNVIAIPATVHQMVNWNLFARLPITIHQRPSSYNIRMFWCKCFWCPCPFLSVLEEWCGHGRVTAALGANVQGVTHNGESFTPLTPTRLTLPRLKPTG